MNELWKDVPGYEGLYQVSSMGRVKSLPRHGHHNDPVILKPYSDVRGYLHVVLVKNKIKWRVSVHRLVMYTFLGPSELSVNHKDECTSNNALSNLEYMTIQDNLAYGTGRERQRAKVQKQVESFDLKTGKTIQVYDGVNCVKADGHSPQAVSRCCREPERHTKHHGVGWRFV